MNLEINYLPVEELKPYKNNARKHGEEDLSAIEASIRDFGFSDPIGVWGPDNIIVEGHGRLLAAKRIGLEKVPCIRLDHLSDEQRRAYALAHNRTAELSTWDELIKAAELEDLRALGVDDLADLGFDIETDVMLDEEEINKGKLAEAFLVSPFSVLRGDSGPWMERKRLWTSLGIKSGEGRGGDLCITFHPGWYEREVKNGLGL